MQHWMRPRCWHRLSHARSDTVRGAVFHPPGVSHSKWKPIGVLAPGVGIVAEGGLAHIAGHRLPLHLPLAVAAWQADVDVAKVPGRPACKGFKLIENSKLRQDQLAACVLPPPGRMLMALEFLQKVSGGSHSRSRQH